MKLRNDFVSNSSSSSFIVISNKGSYMDNTNFKNMYDVVILPSIDGCKEFGWQTEKYYDVWSKLNWAALVILSKIQLEKRYSSDEILSEEVSKPWFRAEEMEKLLKKICEDKFRIKIELNKKEFLSDDWEISSNAGYIDHQSDIRESPENGRMFETYDMLYDFLANSKSYIDNSNDNGGRDAYSDPETGEIPPRPNDYSI